MDPDKAYLLNTKYAQTLHAFTLVLVHWGAHSSYPFLSSPTMFSGIHGCTEVACWYQGYPTQSLRIHVHKGMRASSYLHPDEAITHRLDSSDSHMLHPVRALHSSQVACAILDISLWNLFTHRPSLPAPTCTGNKYFISMLPRTVLAPTANHRNTNEADSQVSSPLVYVTKQVGMGCAVFPYASPSLAHLLYAMGVFKLFPCSHRAKPLHRGTTRLSATVLRDWGGRLLPCGRPPPRRTAGSHHALSHPSAAHSLVVHIQEGEMVSQPRAEDLERDSRS
ncbi:hypothetical protein R3P38DRAFT_3233957 [Favolaschia claudopus]|uniref:Uncharacterized protein n=1 Tax=Favolaschia claudopus TaxID=2862362 RepID=A0AAV9ZGQ1_9AGAR